MHAIIVAAMLMSGPNTQRNAGIATAVVGVVASIVGWSLLGAALQDDDGDGVFRDVCTVGKPCGNTCIEVSDTCHIPTGGGTPGAQYGDTIPRAVPIVGTTLVVLGPVLLVTGVVLAIRSPPRTRRVTVTGTGVLVRF